MSHLSVLKLTNPISFRSKAFFPLDGSISDEETLNSALCTDTSNFLTSVSMTLYKSGYHCLDTYDKFGIPFCQMFYDLNGCSTNTYDNELERCLGVIWLETSRIMVTADSNCIKQLFQVIAKLGP
ncbi:hypothetical protein ABG067_006574 [Albugo candida]|uniref:Uncharacterized protein n=1 Tax=Albugo candida TaxID=65357 RepID=A0A024FTH9_9STRA|nr:unnamed protein product [Albugo candida]|eukprot:CCI10331.1 unnamed protein product [Albugo candida]